MPVDKRITPATASTAAPGRPISAAVSCVVVVVVVVVVVLMMMSMWLNRNRPETLTVSVNSSMKSQTESKNVTSLCSTTPCRISL
jgi:predicted metalloprotease